MSKRSDQKRFLLPKSPEGKYWFSRHTALVSVFKALAEGDCEELANMAHEVLNTEMALDVAHVEEMKTEVINPEKNLVIVDGFKEKMNGS